MKKDSEQQFLEYVIGQLASKPEAIKIVRTVDEMGVLFTVDLDRDDMAKIIGKQGQTAKAIRQILRIIGFNNKVRATMKINDPNDTRPPPVTTTGT